MQTIEINGPGYSVTIILEKEIDRETKKKLQAIAEVVICFQINSPIPLKGKTNKNVNVMEIKQWTHKQIVEIAYRWVLKNGGVGVAFKELKSMACEIPDVIGFDCWQSILIECKVSRSDFFSDKNKTHKQHSAGMGNWRFFACPKGMIKVSELPEKWGLIYVDEKGKARVEHDCRVKKILLEAPTEWDIREGRTHRIARAEENRFEAAIQSERAIMYTALRRLFIKGYVKTIYDKAYNRNATVNDLITLNETTNP